MTEVGARVAGMALLLATSWMPAAAAGDDTATGAIPDGDDTAACETTL